MHIPGKPHGGGGRPEFEPTPEEIEAACAAIQLEWGDAERKRRHVGREHASVVLQVVREGSAE